MESAYLSTNIIYSLPHAENTKLDIYNITGQKITTLVNQIENAGKQVVKFNAGNIANGVYFYRIQYNSNTITKSMR